ncbi:MAG: carboxypeptidase regulatory-like domain-containing protein [Vicinamibacterales bacterium]
MARRILIALVVAALCFPLTGGAQESTGTVRGRVVDSRGAPAEDVVVRAQSPQLTLSRETTTDGNGDYLISHLPPGDYVITFERDAFVTVRRVTRVSTLETAIAHATMPAGPASGELISVSIDNDRLPTTLGVADTWDRASLDRLPVEGGVHSAMTLAVGGAADRASDFLVVVDGAPVRLSPPSNEPPLFDSGSSAIQQVAVAPAGVRTDASRFGAGVISVVTRPGRDRWTGSASGGFGSAGRLADDINRAAPLDGRAKYAEFGLGAPLAGRQTWLFASGRTSAEPILSSGRLVSEVMRGDTGREMWEVKATHALNTDHRLQALLLSGTRDWKGVAPEGAVSPESPSVLGSRSASHRIASIGYSGLIRDAWLVAARASGEWWKSQSDDVSSGLPTFWDLQTGSVTGGFGSCRDCQQDTRSNMAWRLTAGRAYPIGSGLHHFTVGIERSTGEVEQASPSPALEILASRFVVTGLGALPVLDGNGSSWVVRHQAAPALAYRAEGVFLSDEWRPLSSLTVHAGLRWDQQRLSVDGSGEQAARRSGISPRLLASWDTPWGWTLHGSVARYEPDVLDLLPSRLEPAGDWFLYQGPAVNTGTDGLIDSAGVADRVATWLRQAAPTPRYSGLTVSQSLLRDRAAAQLGPAAEWTAGLGRSIGTSIHVRTDLIWRSARGGEDVSILSLSGVPRLREQARMASVGSTSTRYTAATVQLDYRLGVRADLGARYTLSRLRSIRDSGASLPEGLAPGGDLPGDRRHRLKLWGWVALLESENYGSGTLTVLHHFESGIPLAAVSWIDLAPSIGRDAPAFAPYYFTQPGQLRARGTARTDLSLQFVKPMPGLVTGELVVRFDALNLLGKERLIDPEALVVARTALSDPARFSTFNPFTETPRPGVHWETDPRFLAGVEEGAMTMSRAYRASVGFRF